MLLRDGEFETLESLCENFNETADSIKNYLRQYDYVYSEEQRQFRPVDFDA